MRRFFQYRYLSSPDRLGTFPELKDFWTFLPVVDHERAEGPGRVFILLNVFQSIYYNLSKSYTRLKWFFER